MSQSLASGGSRTSRRAPNLMASDTPERTVEIRLSEATLTGEATEVFLGELSIAAAQIRSTDVSNPKNRLAAAELERYMRDRFSTTQDIPEYQADVPHSPRRASVAVDAEPARDELHGGGDASDAESWHSDDINNYIFGLEAQAKNTQEQGGHQAERAARQSQIST
mmetsp:Transcript_72517/g.192844  ORF Transcript_72517/g.192844 Transcript_72517/m.192844 type:complete len:166 (+) Transcript_72517:92-589(+)